MLEADRKTAQLFCSAGWASSRSPQLSASLLSGYLPGAHLTLGSWERPAGLEEGRGSHALSLLRHKPFSFWVLGHLPHKLLVCSTNNNS